MYTTATKLERLGVLCDAPKKSIVQESMNNCIENCLCLRHRRRVYNVARIGSFLMEKSMLKQQLVSSAISGAFLATMFVFVAIVKATAKWYFLERKSY
jgi:hypothetical protein